MVYTPPLHLSTSPPLHLSPSSPLPYSSDHTIFIHSNRHHQLKLKDLAQTKFTRWVQPLLTEKWLFYTLVIINVWPFLSFHYFPTYDGPAHLYNSKLINELLFFDNKTVAEFFVLQLALLPNWTGHALLSVLNLMLPANVSELIMATGFFVLFPVLFRRLVKALNPNSHLSMLILPFTYNFLFVMGFFNFSIATLFLFIVLTFWIEKKDDLISLKNGVTLALLFFCIYLSHIFIFTTALLILGLYTVYPLISKFNKASEVKIKVGLNLLFLITTASIPIFLSIHFFSNRPALSNFEFLDLKTLLLDGFTFKMLMAFAPSKEEIYTTALSVITGLFLMVRIWKRISSPRSIEGNDFWLMIAIVFLILYFTMPNFSGLGGFYSFRLFFLFSLFLLVWIILQKEHERIDLFLAIAFVITSFMLSDVKNQYLRKCDEIAQSISGMSANIEKDAVVMPIDNSQNWFMRHMSNYLGTDKPIIILENYEATVGYFPVNWTKGFYPLNTLILNDASPFFTLKFEHPSVMNGRPVDYFLVLGYYLEGSELGKSDIGQAIYKDYLLIEKNNFAELYGLKSANR